MTSTIAILHVNNKVIMITKYSSGDKKESRYQEAEFTYGVNLQ